MDAYKEAARIDAALPEALVPQAMRFIALVQIGGIHKYRVLFGMDSSTSVNVTKDMNLGSLPSHGVKQFFAAQMRTIRSRLIEDSIWGAMRDEHIE
jgi:hypothetical protein